MAGWLIAGVVVCLASGTGAAEQDKKLIQYGWDVRTPAYVAANIGQMEEKPFDGVAMLLNRHAFNHVFYNRELDDEQTQTYLNDLASIRWDKFTDNFLMMYCRSNMDWFSEEDWGPDGWVLHNVRLCGKATKAGRCVGIFFDTESFWGRRPWWYAKQPGADQRSFAEFQAMVRKLGAQFMDALQDEHPDLVFLMPYMLSNPNTYTQVRNEPDRAKHSDLLKDGDEGLWPAFVNGMLVAVRGKTAIIDGHLRSYYHQELADYTQGVRRIREGAQGTDRLIDSDIWHKYQHHVRAAHGIYADFYCNMLPLRLRSSNMTDDERARWLEHNVYYSLKTSDKYAWYYNEYMNWWEDRHVPPYMEGAIRSAKRKLAAGQPLGFENDAPSRGWRDLLIQREATIEPKTAGIPRVTGDAPTIDGQLDDDAWKRAAELGPFVAYVEAPIYELSAVHMGDTQWTVEIAIPWHALDRVPAKPGTQLAANVAHMRFREWGGKKPQYSTWSKYKGAEAKPSYVRVEPERLGV